MQIDVENVRGVGTGFHLPHRALLSATSCWTAAHNLTGRVVLVVDHGDEECAFLLPSGVAVAFAGPHQKADDAIARDVAYFSSALHRDSVVVTADAALRRRCRQRSKGARRLHLVTPATFVASICAAADGGGDDALRENVAQLREAGAVGGRGRRRATGARRERTADREVLAEALRAELLAELPSSAAEADDDAPAAAYAAWVNAGASPSAPRRAGAVRMSFADDTVPPGRGIDLTHAAPLELDIPAPPPLAWAPAEAPVLPEDVLGAPPPDGRPVRIVIVSDTHGYESQFPQLPDGDVLIHGGDFQMDGGGAKASQEAFDRWLAAQPYAVKIVVRGNHDDHNAKFGRSGARFVARRPALLRVCGLRVLVMPFSRRRRAHTRSPMPGCDVLLTHSPPKFLLDKCYNGENAGSTTLRHAVEQSLAPPQLWICGHVHEARGHAYLESAVGAPKTLVLNAANANVGRASHLVAAPCVADVLPRVAEAADASGGAEQRLLAVGAGLRTGAALYDGKGALLKYERLKCGSRAEMRKAATAWLEGGVTHLALSGDDHPVRREWEAAAAEAASPAAVLTVGRENWEAELLEAKERKRKQARAPPRSSPASSSLTSQKRQRRRRRAAAAALGRRSSTRRRPRRS